MARRLTKAQAARKAKYRNSTVQQGVHYAPRCTEAEGIALRFLAKSQRPAKRPKSVTIRRFSWEQAPGEFSGSDSEFSGSDKANG
jgi:hypothetical protein